MRSIGCALGAIVGIVVMHQFAVTWFIVLLIALLGLLLEVAIPANDVK